MKNYVTNDVYTLFFEPGEVTEIRAYGLSGKSKAWEGFARGAGIVYGYFDNAEAFGKCAEALDKASAPGIYFTINPVNPVLLARAANRLKAADMKTATTSDKDIVCLRWLFIDLDPRRPSGISSSDEELKAAIKTRNKIFKYFRDKEKYTGGIPAVSGNGAHLLVRLKDLALNNGEDPSEDPNVIKTRNGLRGLAAKFDTAQVDVDKKTFNPSRICKIYGTTARKGDHTPTRPHRRSFLEPKYMEPALKDPQGG